MKKLLVSILMVGMALSVVAAQTMAYSVSTNEEGEEVIVETEEEVIGDETLEDAPVQEEETVDDVVTEETTEGNSGDEEEIETEIKDTEVIDPEFSVDSPIVDFNGRPHKFIDANNDGICDNCNEEHLGLGFIDEDGDGICDQLKEHHPFDDTNKDGLCDTCGRHDHRRFFEGFGGNGDFRRHELVDENEDGVCDKNNQKPFKGKHHQGNGKWHRH